MPMTSRSPRGALLAALLLLACVAAPACGSDGGGNAADAAPTSDARALCYGGGGTPTEGAEVELGTGQLEFVAIEDDDEVPLYSGLQGGYHIFGNARIQGMDPGNDSQAAEGKPATWFTVSREDGTVMNVSDCTYPLAYEELSGGRYELPYGRIVQVQARYVPEIYGERVHIKVEVMDGQGRYATDERWAVIVDGFAADVGVDATTGAL